MIVSAFNLSRYETQGISSSLYSPWMVVVEVDSDLGISKDLGEDVSRDEVGFFDEE